METLAGIILNFYRSIGVASVKVIDKLEVGDRIHVKGHITNFDQTIRSMQMRHENVTRAAKGDLVGIKVNDYVRKNDQIYKVNDEARHSTS